MTLENYQSLKSNNQIDPELILMVCNCVENSIKKHGGVNKKKLVIEILTAVFGSLNTNEITNAESQCQYNFDNELIEKIPIIIITGYIIVFNYLKKKL